MTTNAIALKRKLPFLTEKMDTINISLDTLCPHKFQLITRRNGLETVLDAIKRSVAAGIRTKVNVVVMKGVNDDEVPSFVEMTRDLNIEVRFIEYMPFDGKRNHQSPPFASVRRLQLTGYHVYVRQQVERQEARALPDIVVFTCRNVQLRERSRCAERHVKAVPSRRVQRHLWVHHLHDGSLLLLMQPSASHS